MLRGVWPGWHTKQILGRGSSGTVYEVERILFDEKETAAVKVISIPQGSYEIERLRQDGYDEKSIASYFADQHARIINEYVTMKKLKGASNIVSILLMNDDEKGWVILAEDHLSVPDRPAFFIRFYENGTMTYWTKESTGSENYIENQGIYQINTDTILLNGEEYRLFAETTGDTRMTLDAVGEYEIDFSGYYRCEKNEVYQVLFYNTEY